MTYDPNAYPDWLLKAVAHLAAVSGEMTAEQMAQRIHEALEIAEVEKYATQKSQFLFEVSGASEEQVTQIRKHLTAFENSIVEIKRKEEQ